MNSYFNFNFFTALALLTTSCTRNSEIEPQQFKISTASIVADKTLTTEQKTTDLLTTAELLLKSNDPGESLKVSKLALQQDPQNPKAKFLRALNALLLTQKGIMTRIAPLMNNIPDTKMKHQEELANLKLSNKSSEKFLLGEAQDITNLQQFQSYLDSVLSALEDFNDILSEIQNEEFTILANSFLAPDIERTYAEGCELIVTDEAVYEITCPPDSARRTLSFNPTDFQLLKIFTTVTIVYYTLVNGYDYSGAEEALTQLASEGNLHPGVQEKWDRFIKNPPFGKLRSAAPFVKIKQLGQEAVLALRWAISNPSLVCPKGGQVSSLQRIGSMFPRGVCYLSMMNPFVDNMDNAINEKPTLQIIEKKGQSYSTSVLWLAPFTRPVPDLRSLGPIHFDKCDQIQTVGDPTLAGLFLKGDANTFFSFSSPDCPIQ